MVEIEKEYERVYAHILRLRDKAPICSVCKVKLFDHTLALDEYYYDEFRGFRLDAESIRTIYNMFYERYPYHKEDNHTLTNHHVNYMLDLTIPVCSSCHGKIHHSKSKEYEKYKPYDLRNKK